MTIPVLLVDAAAAEVRSRVGPLGWVVLELAVSQSCAGVATISARSIAVQLGVSKDSAARALRRIALAGLIVRCECHGDDGRFTRGRYRPSSHPST